jgi:hypothetical protein
MFGLSWQKAVALDLGGNSYPARLQSLCSLDTRFAMHAHWLAVSDF